MKKKAMISLAAVVCLLTALVSGCGCQKETPPVDPTESAAQTAAPQAAEPVAIQTEVTQAAEPARETVEETMDEDIMEPLPEITEDTRPPIEVTLPDATQPYTDYEKYNDMSAEEQEAYFKSFEAPDDFFAWYNQAKADYDAAHPPIIIDGSTNIEIVP